MRAHSFPPVVDARSRVLILGSMPGKASLLAQQYYAHPRNLFWQFMEKLLGVDRSEPYETRQENLLAQGVAVWDVLEWCDREGSLDSDIDPASMIPNDFDTLLERHPRICTICFNGAKAAAVFEQRVKPTLAAAERLEFHKLPSTSPANASIPFDNKLEAWQVVTFAGRQPGVGDSMFHHVSLPVSDLDRSTRLYDAALGALGYRRVSSSPGFAGYGLEDGKDKLALMQVDAPVAAGVGAHLALAAPSREAVDAFHREALLHGAKDHGEPGLRQHYGPNYYAAFLIDPDGHRLEAVHNTNPR